MNADEFRKAGHELINFVADYLEDAGRYSVLPDVQPGYLRPRLPASAPVLGENWEQIFHDVEEHIFPGITHWQSPHFHAYFPCRTSYPSMLGEILANAINCVGFSWIGSPACTELETIVMDWIGEMIGLPNEFLAISKNDHERSQGCGSIQGTASEALIVCLIAARGRTVERMQTKNPGMGESEILSKIIAYQSDQTHCSFVKGCEILGIKQRALATNDKHELEGSTLTTAIKEDTEKGLIPFFLCATLGTTGVCAFDRISELGPICQNDGIWLHVDSAYAGMFYTCPEYRGTLNGVEFADSFNSNATKSLMVNFDASLLWVKSITSLTNALSISASYLNNKFSGLVIDYKDMQLPLGRKFRALKIWFVIRSYGINGLQEIFRKSCRQAELFKSFVVADDHFELLDQKFGLVTFRVKGSNEVNDTVSKLITDEKKIFMTPSTIKELLVLRFVVCYHDGDDSNIKYAWDIIKDATHRVLGITKS